MSDKDDNSSRDSLREMMYPNRKPTDYETYRNSPKRNQEQERP